MTRLANTASGLSVQSLRTIYKACVLSIADYGSPVWWNGSKARCRPLQALQNQATKKILGVFKTAPIPPCEVEARLLPAHLRLDAVSKKYALRLLLLRHDHPVVEEALSSRRRRGRSRKHTILEQVKESLVDICDEDTLQKQDYLQQAPWDPPPNFTALPGQDQTKTTVLKDILAKSRDKWLETLQKATRTNNPSSYTSKFDWQLELLVDKKKMKSRKRKTQELEPQPEPDPKPRFRRQTHTAFFQLKIGHGYLKNYLHKLGHTGDDKCRCGHKETAEHLLLSCREYSQERRELALDIGVHVRELTLSLLLHTEQGIQHALTFIDKTGIATRKWHLTRNEEEEEEAEAGGEE